MIPYIFAILSLASLANATESNAERWSDFTNNFVTDLAPIIALFGEQVTKQFLSESTSFLDNIIFGVAPMGIITAVVSVLRVYGTPSMKSLIGRSQEPHGVAEAELCSSTSDDVCEMWSNGGICRVFGRPKILEFLYTRPLKGKFYQTVLENASDEDKLLPPSCGIELPRDLFSRLEGHMNAAEADRESELSFYWKEVTSRGLRKSRRGPAQGNGSEQRGTAEQQQPAEKRKRPLIWSNTLWATENLWKRKTNPGLGEEVEMGSIDRTRTRFAPHANLSLNVGIRPIPKLFRWILAVFGVLLQLSFFGYATWATFYHPSFYEGEEPPHHWSFGLAMSGTVFIIFGMVLCAMLIERKSCERTFIRVSKQTSNPGTGQSAEPPEPVMFWLQPGGERVGDQLFNAFAYSEKIKTYVTSWRVDTDRPGKTVDHDAIKHPLIIVYVAISSSISGFICQFVGLRGLHGSVALYQVATILVMTALRALLRSKRLSGARNYLKRLPSHVEMEGHELDWQATNVELAPHDEDGQSDDGNKKWFINDCLPCKKRSENDQRSINGDKNIKVLISGDHIGREIVGFHTPPDGSGDKPDTIAICNKAIRWIALSETGELDEDHPNEAARILHFRSRLAYLTRTQGWSTEIREMAAKLQEALEETAAYIFSEQAELLSEQWKDARAIVWSTSCHLHPQPAENSLGLPIHFCLYHNSRRWKISRYELEAALGLWLWSLKQCHNPMPPLKSKALLVQRDKANEAKSAISLWVTQTQAINEYHVPASTSELDWIPTNRPGGKGYPAVLSVPVLTSLPQDFWEKSQAITESESQQVLLGLETRSSPLQMLAQDIFSIFMARIANTMNLAKHVAPPRLTSIENVRKAFDQPHLGLVSAQIQTIAGKIVNSGVGSPEDAMMSIIPPLVQMGWLPSLESVAQDLLSEAENFRRTGEFQSGKDLFYELLFLGPPVFRERAVRGLGEVYRAAVRSQKPEAQYLGFSGLWKLKGVLSDDSVLLHEQDILRDYKDVLDDYMYVLSYFDGNLLNPQTDQHPQALDSQSWQILRNMDSRQARRRGLTLTAEFDVSQDRKETQRILRWAIINNCPELIEDLWNVSTNLIDVPSRISGPYGSALTAGARSGNLEIINFLVQGGSAKIKIPLHDRPYGIALAVAAAVTNGDLATVKFLVQEAGADVNVSLRHGEYGSALAAAAAEDGNLEIIKFLVQEARADVNMSLQHGMYGSALVAAAYWGRKTNVEFLIGAGADVNLKSETGLFRNALKAALVDITADDVLKGLNFRQIGMRRNKKAEVAEFLRRKGA